MFCNMSLEHNFFKCIYKKQKLTSDIINLCYSALERVFAQVNVKSMMIY